MIYSILSISLGASLGALMRWLFSILFNNHTSLIPLGTLFSNLLGGYLIGLALAFFTQNPNIPQEWKLLIITGFLGGLTTFSTFSAETLNLLQQGRFVWAGMIITLHVSGSLFMTWLGIQSIAIFK